MLFSEIEDSNGSGHSDRTRSQLLSTSLIKIYFVFFFFFPVGRPVRAHAELRRRHSAFVGQKTGQQQSTPPFGRPPSMTTSRIILYEYPFDYHVPPHKPFPRFTREPERQHEEGAPGKAQYSTIHVRDVCMLQ
ncbi:hypothetical protein L873DRAFT_215762 [Choiromyces venosus 120613-1]|uniref:Uncharacterized protein n=1 Tax=Choiromyces venosus 120613-1 TaxID=1336337 RepID=A0A3N4J1Z6_9PEZI|nr:hypothetical protein L873DRAFT_215762 [Choiromyces venosus 120613-1]